MSEFTEFVFSMVEVEIVKLKQLIAGEMTKNSKQQKVDRERKLVDRV